MANKEGVNSKAVFNAIDNYRHFLFHLYLLIYLLHNKRIVTKSRLLHLYKLTNYWLTCSKILNLEIFNY